METCVLCKNQGEIYKAEKFLDEYTGHKKRCIAIKIYNKKESFMKDIEKSLKNIKINTIDFNDTTFVFTFPVKIEEMTESIKKIGLLNPVILFEYDNKYKIISGFKRVSVCKSLCFDTIPAFVLESGSISELRAFMIAVHDNISIRKLNTVEKSIVLNKLKNYHNLKRDEIINDIMPIIGLEQSEKLLECYLALSEIDNDLKEHIVKREIPIKTSSLIASVSKDKLPLISEIIIKLNLGTNKIKELIYLIDEITDRDNIDTGKLRSDLNLDKTIEDERMTLSQKWERIVSSLRGKRFPMWSKIEKKLLRNISSLSLPQNLNLSYPPYLEGYKLRIEVDFSTSGELQGIGQKLIDISKKKELSEIIKLI